MPEPRVADLLNIKSRFLRSAQLERDFNDPSVFAGYVVTDFSRSCLNRISEGLESRSGQRAWRLTGDYGSGKSSFALFLAHWFAGHDSSFPPEIRKVVDLRQYAASRRQFVPVLVTCSRKPLAISILTALQDSLTQLGKAGNVHKIKSEIRAYLDGDRAQSEEAALALILKVNEFILSHSMGKGLLLILDELGKFLEFAALEPERQDVFLLQRLAEAASGSRDKPLFIVCLLHQGFSAYADHLSQSAQREWEKVAGRFEEIIFNQPVEQIANLVASALNVRTDRIPKHQATALRAAMERGLALRWFGSAPSENLLDVAVRLYPMHPTVLPVLIRTFRRFGQNERSLFSFLLSNEPFGLQEFCSASLNEAELYQLHHFYDYVRTNFGHRLAVQSYRSHWNLIDSVVESFATEDELQIKVLKTIGILNLLNDADLLPTEESVSCALSGHTPSNDKQLKRTIGELRGLKRVVYDRGRSRGLCLWPHTSVDLETAYEDARRAIDTPQRVAAHIKDFLETRPIVARRHYVETGNLRYFEIRYAPVSELRSLLGDASGKADGLIVVPLCESEAERREALAFARQADLMDRPNWLVGVPQPLANLAALVQEVLRWEWVSTNTLELNGDKYAREEVSRQQAAVRSQLEKRIQAYVGLRQWNGRMQLEWFHQSRPIEVTDGRHLMAELSRIADDVYSLAPRIHNELVNRRSLSSAAAAARMRLIERMFADATTELLGMDPKRKPPEMSMYLSVLQRTGLHQLHGETWRIAEPHPRSDKCRVLPALRRIREIVQKVPDSRVNVAALMEELRKPPYGVRDGIIPLLLSAFAIAHDKDVAFYKDGTFLRELNGETMLALTKAPQRFDIQYCKIAGVRAELFEKLLLLLGIKQHRDSKAELLDVVKPLCVFVAQLPAYVLNTKKLSATALAVRDAILNAREPAKLLFADLPKACGLTPVSSRSADPKQVRHFVSSLKSALDELRAAYPELQSRLRERLREAFILPGSFQQFRTGLATRAEHILLGVTEPKLRAFCLRLMDDNLPESDWLESLGSFLSLKPPSKWHDAEEDAFCAELAQLAARVHHVENIVFASGKPQKNSVGVRVAITQSDGVEHEQVIHFSVEEEHQLRDLQMQFEALLNRDKRLGLAAASRAIWESLQNGGKAKHD